MTVFPAIDLRGGRCVRLTEGSFERETVYGDDPVAMARRWEAAGARWLHVVDLDGARAGRPVQAALVAAICRAVRIPVQVGGGLRDAAAVAAVLEAGAARAVVGTIAVGDPARCAAICRAHAGRVAIGLDARDGRLRTAGWTEASAVEARAAAAAAAAMGAAAVIYTDIGRDGTQRGPDVEGTRAVARAAGIPVIASGGVGSVDDVRALAALASDGVAGVIVGRALYTGAVDLPAALAAAGDA
ncbi:MAG TPA: 1-(5-phosphoribosyl)-5-[(5-phosphoribosylamino)methylideneamino]imidazole-4-carboxamide isomerase [Candidatus Binatia bacterium]|jgi:phosphoribosylformimino-5-aminoimidazole carboxamide ribotide isomerase|nr:1-(5-phosphoribosyl)-5-[(5-phosphoribosylamino)methylideneamino]imidazole-4-carboxamide isomerase [Candidatus Binatia bacterium]